TRSYGDWSSDVCSSDLEVLLVHFNAAQEFLDGFGAHLGGELARIFLLQFAIFVFEQDFAFAENGDFAGIHNDESLEVKNALEIEIGRASCRERVENRVG